MQGKRINWRQKTISYLTQRARAKGFENPSQMAEQQYNQIYREALKLAKGKRGGANISREVYASLNYQTKRVFSIDLNNNKVTLNPILEQSIDIKKGIALDRMENFFNTFAKDTPFLEILRNDYLSGRITKEEFNMGIKAFKKYNSKWIASGSK